MAISPKMLAVLQKVDAARAEFIAGLRETARKESDAREKTLQKKRAASRVAAQARSAKKK